MSSDTSLGFEARLHQANVWLKQARRDCRVIGILLSGRRHRGSGTRYAETSVYLLQQSVEKAVKSLMVATGEDERKFRNQIGHNSLKAVMNFLEPMFQSSVFAEFLDTASNVSDMGVPDARGADRMFNRIVRMARRDEFRELAVISANEMRPLVHLMKVLYEGIDRETKRLVPSTMELPNDLGESPSSSDTDLFWHLIMSLLKKPPNVPDEYLSIVKSSLDPISPQLIKELRNTNTKLTINRGQLLSDVLRPVLFVLPSLYLLAALTYPHEAYSRYPAPYGISEDPREAIENYGTLGSQHYTPDLGIVALLPDVHHWTRSMLDNLRPLLESVAISPGEPTL